MAVGDPKAFKLSTLWERSSCITLSSRTIRVVISIENVVSFLVLLKKRLVKSRTPRLIGEKVGVLENMRKKSLKSSLHGIPIVADQFFLEEAKAHAAL